MEVGGIEPHTRIVGQGLTLYCAECTLFLSAKDNESSEVVEIVAYGEETSGLVFG